MSVRLLWKHPPKSLFTRRLLQLAAEQKKVRRRHLVAVPLLFLLFQLLWAIWQLQGTSAEELRNGYILLFHHLPIMNTLFLPMMAAVIASRLCDMELKGDTLKLLYTMEKPAAFFDCKYLAGMNYVFLFTVGQGVMILVLGQLYPFGLPLKWPAFLEHLAVTIGVSAMLLAFQQTLSLCSASQLLPLGAGLMGCFLGLFSLFFPPAAARLITWGYYAAFPVAGMDWEQATRIVTYYEVPFPGIPFLVFLAGTMVVYELCKYMVIRKEV